MRGNMHVLLSREKEDAIPDIFWYNKTVNFHFKLNIPLLKIHLNI